MIENTSFAHTSLAGKEFEEVTFKNCDFTESNLTQSKWLACKFTNCNFSLSNLEACRMLHVLFEECKLMGLAFYKCDSRFFSVGFQKSFLRYCNFSNLKLPKTLFKQCTLKECHFNETDLRQTNFSEADLEGTLFHHCNLAKADFTDAFNYTIDPLTNTLKQAKFSLPAALSFFSALEIQVH